MAKILFVQNIEYDYLGVMYVSSVLKNAGHECDLLIQHDPEKIINYAAGKNYTIFAFSIMSGIHQWALKVTGKLKEAFPETPVIFGGVHPTYFPEVIEQGPVDIICRGEGEYAMLDLVQALDTGEDYSNIPNLWIKNGEKIKKNELRSLIEDLDVLPLPDRGLYYDRYPKLKTKKTKYFMASRGCPYNCTFCFNKQLKELY